MRNPWRVQIEELEQPLQRFVFPSKKRAKAFCEEWVGKFGERCALLYSVKKQALIARYTFDGAPRWEAITGSSGYPKLLWRKPPAADPHIPLGASKTTVDEELIFLFSPSAEESTGSGKPSIDMMYTKWRRSRKLSRAGAALAMVLYAHARNRKWEGTIEEIAALSLFSENAARAALLDLRRRGMIRRIKPLGNRPFTK